MSEILNPIGLILYTKDGRNIGNAIIIYYKDNIYTLKTDFGNIVHFSYQEIIDWFYLSKDGFEHRVRPETWRMDKKIIEDENKL